MLFARQPTPSDVLQVPPSSNRNSGRIESGFALWQVQKAIKAAFRVPAIKHLYIVPNTGNMNGLSPWVNPGKGT